MSIQSIQSNINTLEKEISDLAKKIANESKKESDKRNKAISINKSITKNTSASSVASKMKDIARCEKEAGDAIKKRAEHEKKRAEKSTKLADYRKKLAIEENALRKKEQQELKNTKKHYDSLITRLQNEQTASRQQIITQVSANIETKESSVEYDVFISHASEDKDLIVRPLYEAMTAKGITAFYDKKSIGWGDSLRKKIDNGLANSKFAIVVFSQSFFKKKWTADELDGLFAVETEEKMILPLWHDISKNDVAAYSPMLAGRKALKTSDLTFDEIADMLFEMLHK